MCSLLHSVIAMHFASEASKYASMRTLHAGCRIRSTTSVVPPPDKA